ncbi:hypothetical protein V5R04_04340 [Jonesiaceae bacterium BS-20]|uniref:Uncharacterized protein n=1 Tax=Jonesiaceae bacterium BS-20 TaxID=3120821 RepID=A0AAU7DWS3_9MICO
MRRRSLRTSLITIGTAAVFLLGACSTGSSQDLGGPQLTEVEGPSEEYIAWAKEWYGDFYGLTDLPEVEFVRYVPSEELDFVIRQCVIDQGFPAPDGVNFDVPQENQENMYLAQYICARQYAIDEKYLGEWTDEQTRLQYKWTVEYLIPCLEVRGHSISEPPSETAFIDSWNNGGAFFPFQQVALDVPGLEFSVEWDKLARACPQQIPLSIAYGYQTIEQWKAMRQ